MATITEKLRFLIEADPDNAIRGFQQVSVAAATNLGAAEAQAEKTGIGMGTLGTVTAAAGVVVVTAMVKAAGVSRDLALMAGKFSDATGLSTEAASRWIEVGGDVGIQTSKLEIAIGKMARQLGKSPELFDELGIAVVRNKDGITDVNATFLNVIDTLNKIPDSAARNDAAARIMGRGWQSVAEIIGIGKQGLIGRLRDVNEEQVFTSEQVADAREFRERIEDLKDSLSSLVISLGQGATPVLGVFAETLKGAAGGFTALNRESGGVVGTIAAIGGAGAIAAGGLAAIISMGGSVINTFKNASLAVQAFSGGLGLIAVAAVAAVAIYGNMHAAEKEVTKRSIEVAGALQVQIDRTVELSDATGEAATLIDGLSGADAALTKALLGDDEMGKATTAALGAIEKSSQDLLPTLEMLNVGTEERIDLIADQIRATKEGKKATEEEIGIAARHAALQNGPWHSAGLKIVGSLKAQSDAWYQLVKASNVTDIDQIATEFLQLAAGSDTVRSSLVAQAEATVGVTRNQEGSSKVYAEYLRLLENLTPAERDQIDASEDNTEELAARKEAEEKAAKAIEDRRKALEDLIRIEEEAYNQARSHIDARFAYEQAIRDQQRAIEDLIETNKDEEASVLDKEEALADARDSIIDTADAYVELNGKTLDADGKNRMLIDSLSWIAGGLAPDSPLRKAIEAYIGQLKTIPATVASELMATLSIKYASAHGGVPGAGAPPGGKPPPPPLPPAKPVSTGTYKPVATKAMGGQVFPENVYWTGERPEYFRPATRGTIVPTTGTEQSSGGAPAAPIVIQFMLNDRVIQEITVAQAKQNRGRK